MNEKVKTAFFSKKSANEKRDTIEISRSRISFYPKNSIPFPVIRRNTKELRAWLPWKGEFCAQVGGNRHPPQGETVFRGIFSIGSNGHG